MRRTAEASADDILAIDAECPEALFPGDADAIEREFHRLLMVWHPDRCQDSRATEVTAHLIGLHRLLAARREPAAGMSRGGVAVPWLGPLCIPDPLSHVLECGDGRTRVFRVRSERPFELGTALIGDSFVVFLVRPDCEDLFTAGRHAIGRLRYADAAMEREMARHLPVVIECFSTTDGRFALVVAKGADDMPMADVCRVCDESVDPRHVAWMLSSLHHVACYLAYARISHNSLSPDTCFVSPRRHAVTVLGGWWYATAFGESFRALPDWTMSNIQGTLLDGRRGDPRVDLTLIRAIGRRLLGPVGLRNAPAAMRQFLEAPASGDAVAIYRDWSERVLTESFGGRRFVDFRLNSEHVYDRR